MRRKLCTLTLTRFSIHKSRRTCHEPRYPAPLTPVITQEWLMTGHVVSVNTHINQLVILVFVRENRSQIAKCESKSCCCRCRILFFFLFLFIFLFDSSGELCMIRKPNDSEVKTSRSMPQTVLRLRVCKAKGIKMKIRGHGDHLTSLCWFYWLSNSRWDH